MRIAVEHNTSKEIARNKVEQRVGSWQLAVGRKPPPLHGLLPTVNRQTANGGSMRIAVEHNTSKEIARNKVEQRLGQLLGQFGAHAEDLEHSWTGDTLSFKGKAKGLKLEGTVEVTEAAVIIDGKLPLIALPFEGRIREAVQREADSMFRLA